MLVTGTSAVGISQKSWPSHLNRSSLNLGKLAGAEEALRVHQEGRQHLGVAVLAGVHVEHEIDERALQLRAQVPVEGETRAGDLGGALEVQDAELAARGPSAPWARNRTAGGSPQRRTSTLSASLFPTGTDSCGTLGMPASSSRNCSSSAFTCSSSEEICSADARICCWRSEVSTPSFRSLAISALSALRRAFSCSAWEMALRRSQVEFAKLIELRRISARREPLRNAVEVVPEVSEIVHVPPC